MNEIIQALGISVVAVILLAPFVGPFRKSKSRHKPEPLEPIAAEPQTAITPTRSLSPKEPSSAPTAPDFANMTARQLAAAGWTGKQIYWETVARYPEVFPEFYKRRKMPAAEQALWHRVAAEPDRFPEHYPADPQPVPKAKPENVKRHRGRPRQGEQAIQQAEPIVAATLKPVPPGTRADDVLILRALNYPLEIKYRDRNNVVTDRPITAQSLAGRPDQSGVLVPTTLRGFCEKRNGVRYFLINRIIEAIDGETGEILPDLVNRLHEVSASRTR